MGHDMRCGLAEGSEKQCVCTCGGRLHGMSKKDTSAQGKDIRLDELDGSEIKEFVEKTKGKTFRCWCRTELNTENIFGYPHEGGLKDENGTRFWAYIRCPKCRFDWSFWKILRRMGLE